MPHPNATDRNRDVFRKASVVSDYRLNTWYCHGEMTLFLELAREARGQRVLDIGVGMGRTTSFLSLVTDDYVGIDFSPEMLEHARQRHPYADLRLGDARDLAEFGDAEFDAAVFTFNGIDTVSHDERKRVFAAIHRVLARGGLLHYTTLNKDGPHYRQPPWHALRPPKDRSELGVYARAVISSGASLANWWRTRSLVEDHGTWGLAPLPAHRYLPFCHYVTAPEAKRELETAGFALMQMVGRSSRTVDPQERNFEECDFLVLARRP